MLFQEIMWIHFYISHSSFFNIIDNSDLPKKSELKSKLMNAQMRLLDDPIPFSEIEYFGNGLNMSFYLERLTSLQVTLKGKDDCLAHSVDINTLDTLMSSIYKATAQERQRIFTINTRETQQNLDLFMPKLNRDELTECYRVWRRSIALP